MVSELLLGTWPRTLPIDLVAREYYMAIKIFAPAECLVSDLAFVMNLLHVVPSHGELL